MEGLTSEKYLFETFSMMDKEVYFKYRCEGNINFFLSQLLKSNLNKEELSELLPIFNWFIRKTDEYGLKSNISKNYDLFDYILMEDVDSMLDLINKNSYLNYENYIKKYNDMDLISNDVLLNELKSVNLEFKLIMEDSLEKINILKENLIKERKEKFELINKLKIEQNEKEDLVKKIIEIKSFKGWISSKF